MPLYTPCVGFGCPRPSGVTIMSKKNRKAWRASVQKGTVAVSAGDNSKNLEAPSGGNCPTAPHKLRGLARRDWIDQQAQEMYDRRVGPTIDLLIEASLRTVAAFDSQMKAAKGEGEAWGPDVNPYEHRMTGSLIARLLREKRTWLREYRQRIERALEEEAALEEADAASEPQEATTAVATGEAPDFDGEDSNLPTPGTRSVAAISHESS
jgi:hypothetical protein